MAYIGKSPVIGNFVKLDAISVVNGQAAYTMQNGGANFTDYESVNQFLVSLNGTIQAPTDSFTVSGSTLTFASNLATGDVIDFIMVFGNSLSAGTPTDATVSTAKIVDSNVTTAKLDDDAVTAAKINNDIISGSTELATEPADTDEFLVSDAGTLKRIDYSLIKGGGITVASQFRLTSDFATGGAYITSNWEASDTAPQANLGSVTESSGVFSLPSTGFYKVEFSAMFRGNGDGDVRKAYAEIYATTDNSNYNAMALGSNGLNNHGLDYDFSSHASCILDITDTSNYKLKFYVSNSVGTGIVTRGSTSNSLTYVNIIRLGDT